MIVFFYRYESSQLNLEKATDKNNILTGHIVSEEISNFVLVIFVFRRLPNINAVVCLENSEK